MRNPIDALTRLFRRSAMPNAVIAALHTHAIGRPLLVEPAMGQRLIGAWMEGSVDAPHPVMDIDPGTGKRQQSRIAVINISGGLVSRPEPGLCDDGPTSYTAIRSAFDEVMADDSVSAVVFRMESPGGMCSGCFDLSDHIFASRGQKPIIAAVDDFAFSACYALASACDEIWVSRTGGVGSIGVVAYHIDQTAYNQKVGVKVTPIYAGAHKVDFSPHLELSEEAREREQGEVDSIYRLFASSVARYRGMNIDDVTATEALTYSGQAAIDIGLADKLGTFRDVLTSLNESDEQRQARKAAEEQQRQKESRARAVHEVANAEIPGDVAAALLDPASGIQSETIGDRIQHALKVIDLCVAYGDRTLAKDYIVKNINIETVRSQLQAAKAEDGPELDTTPPASSSGSAASASWGKTIKQFGGNPQ